MATPACPSKVASVLRGGESNTAAGLGAASLGRRGFVRKASVEEEPVATPTPPSLRETATPERAAKTRRSGEATLEEALAEIMNEAVGVSPSSPPEKIGASRGERSSGVGGARPEMEAIGRGCPVFEFLAANVLLHDMGVGVIVSLQRELGDRAEQTVNESWSQEWYGWTELAGQISEVQSLEDETVALELAGFFCAEKVRTFLLLVAQNADVPLRTDEERLAELRRDGFERRVGRVWGRNDCMADSLLQLLMAHGVLATDITDVERDAACEANRRELVHSDLPNRRPRDLRGRDDPRAFLEHDRHAQATVEFFLRWFAVRRVQELPDEGVELTVYSRFDSDTLPAARTRICERRGAGRAGPALRFCLYNMTGDGISGFHYDLLLRRGAGLPRASLLRPRAVQASRVVSLHDARPLETAARREVEGMARSRLRREAGERGRVIDINGEEFLETARCREAEQTARGQQRAQEGERGRAVDLDGRDLDRSAGGPSRPLG